MMYCRFSGASEAGTKGNSTQGAGRLNFCLELVAISRVTCGAPFVSALSESISAKFLATEAPSYSISQLYSNMLDLGSPIACSKPVDACTRQ